MKKFYLLTVILLIGLVSYGQQNPRPGSLNIPSSPAFNLLGVTPEVIARPGDVKEFKVDWRIKNYKIAPDLALEAAPFWWLYFNKRGLDSYQKSSNFMRMLSTTSLSFGTAKVDNVNHMAWAVKLNLYRENDMLMDNDYIQMLATETSDEIAPLKEYMDSLRYALKYNRDPEKAIDLQYDIDATKSTIKAIKKSKVEELKDSREAYALDNWNSDVLEFSIGRVYTYNNNGLDSLKIKKAGWGGWLSGSKGVGRNALVTSMIRINKIGDRTDFLVGANYRYGTHKYNFYVELLYHKMNNNPVNEFAQQEIFSDIYAQDIGNGWIEFEEGVTTTRITMAYGGEFKLRNNILLNFSLRTILKEDIKFSKLLPVANVVCLMQ